MLRLDWANPKITLEQLEEFLSPYLESNYDGLLFEDNYVYIRTLDGQLTSEQEKHILDYTDSLNDIPKIVTVNSGIVSLTSPQNEHQLLPHGMFKGYFNSRLYTFAITLSNKNGRTFTYSCLTDPEEEFYIIDSNAMIHCEIESVDTVHKTITLQDGNKCGCTNGSTISNGSYVLSKPYEMLYKLPTIEGNTSTRELVPGFSLPSVYLWGYMTDIEGNDSNDFIEVGIECVDGVSDGNGGWVIPPEGWELDYDYSWVRTLKKSSKQTVKDVDGAPGNIPEGFRLRFKYFYSKISLVDNIIELWTDCILTMKG